MNKYLKTILIIFTLIIVFIHPVFAQNNEQGIAQNYLALTQGITSGEIVSLIQRGLLVGVYPTSGNNASNMFGVINTNPLVDVGIQSPNMLPVVTSGKVSVLVSNINGNISIGDIITSSQIPGIGAKNTQSGYILGTALENFNQLNTIKTETISGKKIEIKSMTVLLGIQKYNDPGALEQSIVKLDSSITGKTISFVRIVMATIIFLLGFVTFIYEISATSKQAIKAISRNPMSKKTVQASMWWVIMIVTLIFILCLTTSYILLMF